MDHTDEVAGAAADAMQKQDEFEPIVNRETDDRFDGEPPIDNLNELYGRVIFGTQKSPYLEMTKSIPTGYLTEAEIRWMHGLQDIMRDLGLLERRFQLPIGPTAEFMHRKMEFIPRVSMSRQGFAVKEISQNRMQSDERINMDDGPDEPGLLDRLKGAVSGVGGVGGDGVIGKPDYGNYTQPARQRSASSRPQQRQRYW